MAREIVVGAWWVELKENEKRRLDQVGQRAGKTCGCNLR